MNLKEKLNNFILEEPKNTPKYLISKSLLNYLKDKTKPTISQIAEDSFLNKSSITTFSKKMGYDGFKNLIETLWFEEEKYFNFKNINNSIHNGKQTYISLIEQIYEQKNEIDKVSELLNSFKEILFFSSYQTRTIVDVFHQELVWAGYNSKFLPSENNGKIVTEANEKSVCIFIVSGLDNKSLELSYNKLKEKNIPIVLISTKSQMKKFFDPFVYIHIPSSESEIREWTKIISLNTIFSLIESKNSEINVNLKNKFSESYLW
ncbi:hypothetical protein CK556_01580 [Mesoplasma chauliocola]|uniref:MurR/RpiR family transcriptional regulator n=1 Tax=Mesoplasma chauliocola TaxID=216427 RepID=A0A249SN17_9MOLU|nr:hypothetical protein [Mesoplasma chauliocola]ASZ09046.1 hypothetical protein CK556_01580 [Mesoplasma chauliocola]